jgi:hypothetical protein
MRNYLQAPSSLPLLNEHHPLTIPFSLAAVGQPSLAIPSSQIVGHPSPDAFWPVDLPRRCRQTHTSNRARTLAASLPASVYDEPDLPRACRNNYPACFSGCVSSGAAMYFFKDKNF